MHPLLHDTYYQDRRTERALIYDFPADEALIRGLHAMQSHFYNRNIPIEIPVVRIMNTAHWLAAYMFNTTCSGDQMEYDALTYNSVGRDKQLMFISLIVLVAMLKRTEGFRARQCRNVLTEDRSEDFYEGISLYEQFLESHDEHFAEEDFMVDIMAQVKERDEIIAEQTKQIITLQKQLNMSEKNNAPVINVAGNYIDIHDNHNCNIYATEPKEGLEDERVSGLKDERDTNDILGIPHEGKYTEVRKYIEDRIRFDEEFREFVENNSRVALCKRLSEEFGWTVDQYALGRNINRNRK